MADVKECEQTAPPILKHRCRDFDSDCPGMGDALSCFLYDPEQGYCPLLIGESAPPKE